MAINTKRVAITGIGAISPLGRNLQENVQGLIDLKTGVSIHNIEGANHQNAYYGKVTAEIKPQMNQGLSGQYKFLNRGGQLALAAAIEAMKGQDLTNIEPEERAFYLATGDLSNTGCEFMYPANKAAVDEKTRVIDPAKLNKTALNKVNPFFLLDSIANNPFSFISAYFELMGENTTVASLSPCGSIALELAFRSIRQDRASIALVAGSCSWINSISLYEMEGLGLLSRCKNGAASYAPFDRKRDGFIPSEGGAAIILEREDLAIKRGSHIYGYLLSCANGCDISEDEGLSVPHHISKKTIETALRDAGIGVGDLAFICAHGSGSKKGDLSEMNSIKQLFSQTGISTQICALKPYTGHMGAASDLADIILSLSALKRGIVPATLNLKEPEEEFAGLPFSKDISSSSKRAFLSLSNGLGSQSSAAVVEIN